MSIATLQLKLDHSRSSVFNQGDTVVFDTLISPPTADIQYNSQMGTITIYKPGVYFISWWIAIETTAGNKQTLDFALVTSDGREFKADSPHTTAQLVGTAIIHVAGIPITVKLINSGDNTVTIGVTSTPQAILDMFEITDSTGPTGAQGPTGPQGNQGSQGPTGLQGLQGPTGVQGPIGPAGIQGPTGLQGPIGQQGLPGITGPEGKMGPQGPTGLQGEVGPKGSEGPIGPTGNQGDIGPKGPTGEKGPKGDIGSWESAGVYLLNTIPTPSSGATIASGGVIPFDNIKVQFNGVNYTNNQINISETGYYLITWEFIARPTETGSDIIVQLEGTVGTTPIVYGKAGSISNDYDLITGTALVMINSIPIPNTFNLQIVNRSSSAIEMTAAYNREGDLSIHYAGDITVVKIADYYWS